MAIAVRLTQATISVLRQGYKGVVLTQETVAVLRRGFKGVVLTQETVLVLRDPQVQIKAKPVDNMEDEP